MEKRKKSEKLSYVNNTNNTEKYTWSVSKFWGNDQRHVGGDIGINWSSVVNVGNEKSFD